MTRHTLVVEEELRTNLSLSSIWSAFEACVYHLTRASHYFIIGIALIHMLIRARVKRLHGTKCDFEYGCDGHFYAHCSVESGEFGTIDLVNVTQWGIRRDSFSRRWPSHTRKA